MAAGRAGPVGPAAAAAYRPEPVEGTRPGAARSPRSDGVLPPPPADLPPVRRRVDRADALRRRHRLRGAVPAPRRRGAPLRPHLLPGRAHRRRPHGRGVRPHAPGGARRQRARARRPRLSADHRPPGRRGLDEVARSGSNWSTTSRCSPRRPRAILRGAAGRPTPSTSGADVRAMHEAEQSMAMQAFRQPAGALAGRAVAHRGRGRVAERGRHALRARRQRHARCWPVGPARGSSRPISRPT